MLDTWTSEKTILKEVLKFVHTGKNRICCSVLRSPVALEYAPGLQAKQAEAPVSFQVRFYLEHSPICLRSDNLNMKYSQMLSVTEKIGLKINME